MIIHLRPDLLSGLLAPEGRDPVSSASLLCPVHNWPSTKRKNKKKLLTTTKTLLPWPDPLSPLLPSSLAPSWTAYFAYELASLFHGLYCQCLPRVQPLSATACDSVFLSGSLQKTPDSSSLPPLGSHQSNQYDNQDSNSTKTEVRSCHSSAWASLISCVL